MTLTGVTCCRANLAGVGVTGEGRGLGAPAPLTADEATDRIGTLLCARVFDPLREAFGDRQCVFLSPDVDLTRLPFDDYEFRYLAAGRDLVRFGKEATRQASAPLVAADPDFNLASQVSVAPERGVVKTPATARNPWGILSGLFRRQHRLKLLPQY